VIASHGGVLPEPLDLARPEIALPPPGRTTL
jgi:hypothetical protein